MLSSDVREWDCERPPTTRLNQLLLQFRNWGQVARSDWLISAHLTLILLSDWLISIRSNNMCWPTECLYYQEIIIIWDLNLLIIDQQIHCLIALWSQNYWSFFCSLSFGYFYYNWFNYILLLMIVVINPCTWVRSAPTNDKNFCVFDSETVK